MRRKRTGVADQHRSHWLRRLQGFVTESLGVTLPSFRKLDDFLCDCVSGRGYDPVCVLEGYKSHLEGDAQETSGLRIEPVALQIVPDRHGCDVRFKRENI